MNAINATMSRKATRRAMRRRRLFRSLVSSTLALVATTGIALATTGGTYAIWTKSAAPTDSTITAGTAALTVTPPANVTNVAPGRTVGQPFTVENTGDVPLTLTFASAAPTGSLTRYATVQVTASDTCDPNAAAVWRRANTASVTTPSAAPTVAAHTSITLCFSVTIATSAGSNTENGSLATNLTVSGAQS